MKQLSPDTDRLISDVWDLCSPRWFWQSPFWHDNRMMRVIVQVGDTGELPAVLALLPFVSFAHTGIARTASLAIDGLMAEVTPQELLELDQQVRTSFRASPRRRVPTLTLTPARLKNLASTDRYGRSILGVLSFADSGYIREASVKLLAGRTDGSEVPFLLIRLNDWVPEVRQAARAAINARLRADYAGHFARNMPLVLRLDDCVRLHKDTRIDWSPLFGTDEWAEAAKDLLSSEDRAVRRWCFRFLAANRLADLPELLTRGLAHADALVRLIAVENASRLPDDGLLRELLQRALTDFSARVRQQTLLVLHERFPDQSRGPLHQALFDPSPAIRQLARHHLGVDKDELARRYREAIGSAWGEHLRACIAGLGETGSQADAASICGLLHHSSPRTRAAAVRALSRLDPESSGRLMVQALADASPRVSREARAALVRNTLPVDQSPIRELFETAGHEHVRANALIVLASRGKWQHLDLVITAHCAPDPRAGELARSLLLSWMRKFNTSFVRPTPEQVERILLALDECGYALERDCAGEIRFMLQ